MSQDPPQTFTFGSARNCGAVSTVMPPVGQKAMSGKGPASAFSIGMPPAAVAGKNFRNCSPSAMAVITSLALATPGSSGRPAARQAAPSASV